MVKRNIGRDGKCAYNDKFCGKCVGLWVSVPSFKILILRGTMWFLGRRAENSYVESTFASERFAAMVKAEYSVVMVIGK